ncbi:hypothetical protein EB72_24875 [Mycobacterium sp. SWH-M1]|nr:hypothetical protein EB72_24875 [Mycobacterium sp. SWH-M1]
MLMPALTYFTARLFYRAITADAPEETGGDVNTDPETKGIYAGVTITPFIKDSAFVDARDLQAGTLTPDIAMLVLAPVRARLDNGQLKITAEQADVRLVAQTPVLGLPTESRLCYRFDFFSVTFNGGPQELESFAVAAPTTDTVLNLATATRIPL